uniref:Uncharacterized protein n=1 Tax=Ditylenchus dipsaci TaxID=166011 RepID=A0A915D2H2_9BILA
MCIYAHTSAGCCSQVPLSAIHRINITTPSKEGETSMTTTKGTEDTTATPPQPPPFTTTPPMKAKGGCPFLHC